MTKIMKNIVWLIIFFVAVFFSYQLVRASGLGVSPPFIINDKLAPGVELEKEIFVSRTEEGEDLEITVTPDLPDEIKDWFSFEPKDKIIIPKDKQEVEFKVIIKVPKDAKEQQYKGYLRVAALPADVEIKGSGAKIAVGSRIDIDLKVLKQEVHQYEIKTVEIPQVASGKPIKAIIKLQNDGNVYDGPDKVRVAVFSQFHDERLAYLESQVTGQVPPFKLGEVLAEFENNLLDGQYWADIQIYDGDKVVKEDSFPFHVGLEKTKKESVKDKTVDFFTKKSAINLKVLGGVVGALVILGILILIIKKNKEKN